MLGGIQKTILQQGGEEEETDDGSLLLENLVQPACAFTLFVLTLLVTPANIYMFTHGATMMGEEMMAQPLSLQFHAIRFVVQVFLLSLLLTLAKDSFFYAWGDELD